MLIKHGISVVEQVDTTVSLAIKQPAIAIVGTASSGTDDLLTQITNLTTAEAFGKVDNASPQQLAYTISILQRYGVGNIIAVKVADEASAIVDNKGLNLLLGSFSQLNEIPEVILTPGMSADATIAKAIEVARKLGAFYIVDIPEIDADDSLPTTVADVIADRGTSTGVGTKQEQMIVCYPFVTRIVEGTTISESLATHMAGVIAKTESDYALHYSPSNKDLLGVSGTVVSMNFSYSDSQSDTEQLNQAGVVTVNRGLGSSYVTWGNHNSQYDGSNKGATTYINIIRVRERITKDVENASKPFLSRPSNLRTARLLEEAIARTLSNLAPSLLPGHSASFLPEESDLANGKLFYKLTYSVPSPAEQFNITSILQVQI